MFTKKGEYGYISAGKKRTILFTIFCFAVSASLYIAGYIATKSNRNLLTIVAVLGCLPACKSAVNMIMFLKAKGCPKDCYEAIVPHIGGLICLFDLQITSYERAYQIDSVVLEEKNICAYTSNPKCRIADAETHIKQLLIQNGLKDYTVKVFTDLNKYTGRMDKLKENCRGANPDAVQLLKDICI